MIDLVMFEAWGGDMLSGGNSKIISISDMGGI